MSVSFRIGGTAISHVQPNRSVRLGGIALVMHDGELLYAVADAARGASGGFIPAFNPSAIGGAAAMDAMVADGVAAYGAADGGAPKDRAALDCWRAMAALTADFIMHDPDGGNAEFSARRAEDAFAFWSGLGTPIRFPYGSVPAIELVQKQMVAVLPKLSRASGSGTLRGAIESIRRGPSEPNGANIIRAMGIDPCDTVQALQQAIVQSLLTPHRQIELPTCNMDSIIAKESRWRPENLVGIYVGISTTDIGRGVAFCANPTVPKPVFPVVAISSDGKIEVRPNSFYYPDNAVHLLSDECAADWGDYEITEHLSAAGCRDGFDYPVHDLNDAFLAMFMQKVYQSASASTAFITARDFYYGTPGNAGLDLGGALVASIDDGTTDKPLRFTAVDLTKFQRSVVDSGRTGEATIFSQPFRVSVADGRAAPGDCSQIGETSEYLDNVGGHIEIIDVDKVVAFDPARIAASLSAEELVAINKESPCDLTGDKFAIIGDRNMLLDGEPVYMAIARVDESSFQVIGVAKNAVPPNTWCVCLGRTGWLALYDN
ncbi:MAG: hypothetical protein LBI39_02070 [Puniceicoccales bacterium]|nr:hypothetical protein [Puniceicoccales bacterium]